MKNALVARIERITQFIGEPNTMAEFAAQGCTEDNVRIVLDKLSQPGGYVEPRLENPVLHASLRIMEKLNESGRIGKSARPTIRFTQDEAERLLRLVWSEGVKQFCVTHDVTEASLGAAVLGRTVALATAAQLRGLL